ncbi:MAG TPA: hypothetical protein VGG99_26785 [Acetobacteraceae bacterium]
MPKSSESAAEQRHDAAVEGSFPASDPPANSGIVGPKRSHAQPRRGPPHGRDDESRPKGTPTDERHAMETAHVWEVEVTAAPCHCEAAWPKQSRS